MATGTVHLRDTGRPGSRYVATLACPPDDGRGIRRPDSTGGRRRHWRNREHQAYDRPRHRCARSDRAHRMLRRSGHRSRLRRRRQAGDLSAEDFGGIDALVAAAKAEGQLNVIALPDNWANYGKIKAAVRGQVRHHRQLGRPRHLERRGDRGRRQPARARTPLPTSSTSVPRSPSTASTTSRPTRSRTGTTSRTATRSRPASRSTTTPAACRSATTRTRSRAPKSLDDLLGSEYAGKVALNGDPTQAGAAVRRRRPRRPCSPVVRLDDFHPRHRLLPEAQRTRATSSPSTPTPATIASGETTVVIDWSYNNLAAATENGAERAGRSPPSRARSSAATTTRPSTWTRRTPRPLDSGRSSSYSPEAQNLFLVGGAYPVTLAAMVEAGTVDQQALDAAGRAARRPRAVHARADRAGHLAARREVGGSDLR